MKISPKYYAIKPFLLLEKHLFILTDTVKSRDKKNTIVLKE